MSTIPFCLLRKKGGLNGRLECGSGMDYKYLFPTIHREMRITEFQETW
jgi:hypothetical protein